MDIITMEITIQTSSTRDILDWTNTDEPFFEGLDMIEETRYSFEVRIEIHKGKILVGDFYGLVFDEETIKSAGEDLVAAANKIDVDIEGPEVKDAIKYLVNSEIFKKGIDGDLLLPPLFDCYVQNFFLHSKDENEKRIIAEYLFKNLSDIFLYFFHIQIRCFVTYPVPQHLEYGQVVDTPDEVGTIKAKMIEFHKKMGYTPLGESGYFAVNCTE